MTSTFKLTRAEFKKIFKRPSIFIMAIILVVSIFISLSIFDPSTLGNSSISYDNAESSQEYYNSFYDPLQTDSKAEFDKDFALIDESISYFNALNINESTLTSYYSDVIKIMDKMIAEESILVKETLRPDLLKAIEDFLKEYKSLTSLQGFENLTSTTLTSISFLGYAIPENYYTIDVCAQVNQFYYKVQDKSNNAEAIVNEYKTNKVNEELKKVLNCGNNFVYTTLKGLSEKFSFFVGAYNKNMANWSDQAKIQNEKKNLATVINTYDEYLKQVLSSPYPIILINKEDYYTLERTLTEAKTILNADANNLEAHKTISKNLDALNIVNIMNNLTKEPTSSKNSKIQQVHISTSQITELEKYQSKVNENKAIILENIESLKLDESKTNISKEITNYKLLESSYEQLVSDKILFNITNNYDNSIYSNFYGYGFDEFNKFEANEKTVSNIYYIDNNKYSNSYNQNFSYNQNSGEKTNAFDFMYFAMELCTLIITIFAMMLVCNLITGETESGTIKLLLVRPYKRSKIITAKLLASIFFVLTFMLFSSLITFAGGYFVYGYSSTPILSIINGTTAVEMSPLALMIINVLTLTFDVIFFVILALMISVLCKNYAASISCSLVLLIVNYALNILFGGAFWYSLLPGMNLHLFKYFGNSFITNGADITGMAGLIKSLLITGIESSMNLWYSLLISFAYGLVFIAISYSVFQKRDF